MNFLGQGNQQKLEHYRETDRQTNTQTDATERITLPPPYKFAGCKTMSRDKSRTIRRVREIIPHGGWDKSMVLRHQSSHDSVSNEQFCVVR